MSEKIQPVPSSGRTSSTRSIEEKRDEKTYSKGSAELSRTTSSSSDASLDSKTIEKSFGVRKSETLVKQYDTNLLRGIYFFSIFIAMFVNTIEGNVTGVFIGFATDSYKQHSLMSTIDIIKKVIAAASLPAYARLSDIFGRVELFCLSLVFRTVGLIIMSQANDINRYAGGMVLYSLGSSGGRMLWQINLSDASSLRYRLLAIAILNLPAIINTWASGEIVDSLLDRYSWSFGIALWAFTFPLSCIPYLACSVHMRLKARKTEEWQTICAEEKASTVKLNEKMARYERELENGASPVWNYTKRTYACVYFWTKEAAWRVDFIGCILIIAMLGCLLVPLTLAGGVSKKWAEASTIVPLVIGFCLIPCFVFWEMKLATNPLIPFPLLRDRGIWAAFSIAILYTFISNMPNSYAFPVLYVGMNASKVVATRTPLLLHFVCALTLPAIGFVLSKVRRTKGFILFGIMVWFIAMGLFVHFRGDNDGLRGKYFRDGVAVGMCLLGFGQGFFNRLVSVSAQTCTNHEYMASVTAMFNAIYQIGASFGKCVSGAIWTQTMYDTIKKHMVDLGADPELAKDAYKAPYTFIETYKWGSTPRIAVVLAYAEVQKKLCIVGLCLCAPLLFFALFLRDHYLSDAQSLEEVDEEQQPTNADTKISKMVFTNDNDPIFNILRKGYNALKFW
ncbi:hypothetical protein FT663_04773 [Candidozyma haemuli var. vulneris]|uniref:Major facilitator superfamily (MFS) profile domain-containing protein n=1 Tax=Candidozyma haemuli TaxID=45357 RepID=A0A2V1B076_9ASCO|nr:hypothetical protein CXQ85_003161 [[Candida] haemuloni]KAF3986700.1 hypothetical protein FT663_04773 [[Candida] haemuloni var. vulneris]KAF3986799.1 hypothetical protein FT662_04363 [[Candida] haemuloni var. vulneris]PVH23424.1 hypothetical protein CXQ85_003161 [[Candida] haemuloni]